MSFVVQECSNCADSDSEDALAQNECQGHGLRHHRLFGPEGEQRSICSVCKLERRYPPSDDEAAGEVAAPAPEASAAPVDPPDSERESFASYLERATAADRPFSEINVMLSDAESRGEITAREARQLRQKLSQPKPPTAPPEPEAEEPSIEAGPSEEVPSLDSAYGASTADEEPAAASD